MKTGRIRVVFLQQWDNFRTGDEVNFPPDLARMVVDGGIAREVKPIGPGSNKAITPESVKHANPAEPPAAVGADEIRRGRRRR